MDLRETLKQYLRKLQWAPNCDTRAVVCCVFRELYYCRRLKVSDKSKARELLSWHTLFTVCYFWLNRNKSLSKDDLSSLVLIYYYVQTTTRIVRWNHPPIEAISVLAGWYSSTISVVTCVKLTEHYQLSYKQSPVPLRLILWKRCCQVNVWSGWKHQ